MDVNLMNITDYGKNNTNSRKNTCSTFKTKKG